MSKNVLVVIDMQNDFIDGALGTKEAQAIIENVYQVIQSFEGEVVFTRDTHFENYADTQEGKNFLFHIASREQMAGKSTAS